MSAKPREWRLNNLGADNFIDGPMCETSDVVRVIEYSAYEAAMDRIASDNDLAAKEICRTQIELAKVIKERDEAMAKLDQAMVPYADLLECRRKSAKLAEAVQMISHGDKDGDFCTYYERIVGGKTILPYYEIAENALAEYKAAVLSIGDKE